MSKTPSAIPPVQRPPLLPIFGRVLTLFSGLMICATLSFTWWSKGISWIYDSNNDGSVPILACPENYYTFTGTVPVGDFCQVSLTRTSILISDIATSGLFNTGNEYHCIRPTNSEDPIICNMHEKCADVCQMADGSGQCRLAESLPPLPYGEPEPVCRVVLGISSAGFPLIEDVACRSMLYGSYCDSAFKVTSSNSLAMRGIFAGILLVTLMWLVAEFILRSVDIDLRTEKATGMARMDRELPEKRAILRQSLEERWRQESMYPHAAIDSICDFDETPTPSVRTSEYSPSLAKSNPKSRFSTSGWKRRLLQWQKLRKEKSHQFQTKVFLRTLLLNSFFVCLLVCTFYVIILISPQNISTTEEWDESLIGKMSVWRMTCWVDYLIFADILLDMGLFLLACMFVKWPRAAVFTRHIQSQIASLANTPDEPKHNSADELGYSDSDGAVSEVASSATVSFVLNQSVSTDTCLMIACHCSTMTVERCASFANTLRAALAVFPPSHIFVCDNGPTIRPQDETQFVAKQVHPDINYLYVPEGNKTFAFYWCNKYWIPLLTRTGIVPNFTYAVIIDDDVPLPADLHIPHEHLKKDLNIKAVHFPITATTPNGNPPNLVRCQDIEYKLAAVHKLFQANMSRSLSCHGAIALWDRETMAEVFHEHDTVFNGEDLYMGLCLLRKRDKSTIISCAQTIVPTYAPDTWSVLFRQRVKSWELTSHKKSFTFLLEVVNPVSFFHLASLCLKPYFVQELMTILLDWLRVFLLMGLLLRDTLGLLLMTAVFTLLLYVQLALFQWVILRERGDLRATAFAVAVFPFYKLGNLFVRVCALCQNLLVYSHERKGTKISVREDEIRDIPPTPPHWLVDWFSVWEEPTEVNAIDRMKSYGSNLGTPNGRANLPSRFRM